MRKFICLVFWLPLIVIAQDPARIQQADNFIYDGNEAFDASNSTEAEKNYRRALATGEKKDIAKYNMGATLQHDNYVQEALRAYADVTKTTTERPNKHRTFHNVGNALMQVKDYKGAVEAYKNALRNNPKDDETRYNYALAKKMLEEDEKNKDQNNNQQDNQDNQDNQNNQDQQDKQNQDKEGDKDQDQKSDKDQEKESDADDGENKSDQKESDDKNQDQQGDAKKEQQQPQGQPTQLSPQQVQNLLEAMNNEEKKVQDKVNAKKVTPVGSKSKKDW